MASASHYSGEHVKVAIELAKKLEADPDKKKRLQAQECKSCFYVLGKLGCAAMTSRECSCCGKDMMFGSTCTDALCLDCAKKHGLCKHCGGDIDMKQRRKWPEQETNKEIE